MLFGLGTTELLLLAAIVVLVFGPRGLGRAVRVAKKVDAARRELTPQNLLRRVMEDEPRSKKRRSTRDEQVVEERHDEV